MGVGMRTIGRRSFLAFAGVSLLCPYDLIRAGRAQSAPVDLLTVPLELTGEWGNGSPLPAVTRVVTRVREVALSGVRLLSDRQPERLRIDDHSLGLPAIWLHTDLPKTAWVIVDIGPADWCKLAYQFGHELCHVLCNSWEWSARRTGQTQWLEEAFAEAFSIRGLGLLAASWEENPPFAGDALFANAIRQYRQNLVDNYKKAAPPGPDIAACYRSHCRDFTQGKGDPIVLAVLNELESDPACVEDLGAVNRWPERSAAPVEQYLSSWQASCPEIGAVGHLPRRLHTLLT
jgi:hypothetical protein